MLLVRRFTYETFNGAQKIVVERSLYFGAAKTKKPVVFLTLTKHCDRIIKS